MSFLFRAVSSVWSTFLSRSPCFPQQERSRCCCCQLCKPKKSAERSATAVSGVDPGTVSNFKTIQLSYLLLTMSSQQKLSFYSQILNLISSELEPVLFHQASAPVQRHQVLSSPDRFPAALRGMLDPVVRVAPIGGARSINLLIFQGPHSPNGSNKNLRLQKYLKV